MIAALGSAVVTAALLAAAPDAVASPAPHVAEDGQRSARPHLQLDADALWGIGGQMFLGAQLRLVTVLEHWATTKALGTWDLGGAFAYHNEATFLAPWIDRDAIDGAGHRLVLVAHVGHTVHMGRRRRLGLGLHVFGGWNYWRSAYSVHYPEAEVSGSAVVDRHLAVVGGEVRVTYRLHRRVGVNLAIGAPAPTASNYAITIAHLGLGLSFYLR